MRKFNFKFNLVLSLLVLASSPVSAQSQAHGNLALEDQLSLRIDKVKDLMTEVVAKLNRLSQDTESNSTAFFAVTRTNKDASTVLNTRFQWMNVEADTYNKTAFAQWSATQNGKPTSLLTVPSPLKEKITGLKFEPNFKTDGYDLKSFDFRWLSELAAYDHWNMEDNSPITHLQKLDFEKLPYPDLSPLLDWAKLRLIKGLKENSITAAIDECLHLGRLAYSTETLFGQEMALNIQETVTQFAISQKKQLRFDLRSFYKQRFLFASLSNALSIIHYDPRTYVKLLALNGSPGFCAGLNHASRTLLVYRPLLKEELEPIYLGITNIIESTPKCRWILLKKMWSGKDTRMPDPFAYLSRLGLKSRKTELEKLKASITSEEYMLMAKDLNNPKWAIYYIYLLDLKRDVAAMFANLN
jgi:hypothetical protein